MYLNPFQAEVPFLYPLKTSENQPYLFPLKTSENLNRNDRFSDLLRGHRNGTLV